MCMLPACLRASMLSRKREYALWITRGYLRELGRAYTRLAGGEGAAQMGRAGALPPAPPPHECVEAADDCVADSEHVAFELTAVNKLASCSILDPADIMRSPFEPPVVKSTPSEACPLRAAAQRLQKPRRPPRLDLEMASQNPASLLQAPAPPRGGRSLSIEACIHKALSLQPPIRRVCPSKR